MMKTIRIAHLYYDLLNLYGENGNIRYLVNKLENMGVKTKVDKLSVGDNINFKNYDFFYIGSGCFESILIALDDIMKYKSNIKEAINDKKYFLITGTGLDLFGSKIVKDGKEYEALDILNYETIKHSDIVGSCYFNCSLIKEKVIGFQNRDSIMKNIKEDNLFSIIEGFGYDVDSKIEGIKHNNFYGTYLIGPFLIRNPYFTDMLVKNMLDEIDIKYNPCDEDISYKAYKEYLNNFYANEKAD